MTAAPYSAPGRLERRKARTRAAIVTAASRLFHEKGYEETSIQQIAELADAGVGTLYGYFTSKEEILKEVLHQARDEALEDYLAGIDAQTPAIERICRALESMAGYLRTNRTILLAMFQVATRNKAIDEEQAQWLYDGFSEMLRLGMESGEFRALPLDSTIRMLISTYMMAFVGLGLWQGREDDPDLVAELDALVRALLAP
jgi:AcrR family transcriptional regulator